MRAELKVALVLLSMSNNTTEHLVRIGVDDPRRARVFLGLLRIKLVVMAIREGWELQQVVITLAVSVLAVLGRTVTVGLSELDGRAALEDLSLAVIAVGEPVRIATPGLAVGEGRVVRVALGLVLVVEEALGLILVGLGVLLIVQAGPGLGDIGSMSISSIGTGSPRGVLTTARASRGEGTARAVTAVRATRTRFLIATILNEMEMLVVMILELSRRVARI